MKFLKLDKKKGSGGPSIKSRYAYLIHIDDIDYLPGTNEKGVRIEGDILLKEDCTMMPLYLTSSSQEFSYDNLGDDDEKSYLVKFSGNHPGTELEALEFAKNMIEQPYLVLIPSCNDSEPWKLLGELTNPLIFTSSHKGGSDSSKFTFNFEQRIGSEFIYFSYGGVEVPSEGGGGVEPPSGGFDPTKWARIDASNIDPYLAEWRAKLGIVSGDTDFTQHGPITTTSNSVTIGLSELGENFAMISGIKYIEATTNPETPKPFTAVSPGMLKVVIIQALPDAEVFHLVEGIEAPEAIDPDYGGLLVKRIIVSDFGQVVEGDLDAFQLKANEAWVNLLLNDVGSTIQTVSIHHAALRFNIVSGAANIKIGGFRFYARQFLYDGIEITLRNETAGDLEITTIAGIGITSIDSDGLPISLKQFESIDLAYHLVDGVFYALKTGGDVFDPTSLQSQIDTEIVNRALEDAKKLDKPLSPNNTSERLIEADGGTTPKSNYQRSKQFFVSLPATVSEDWKGCIVFFTSSGNLTVPIGLTSDFTFNGVVDNGVTLTPAITSPMAWLGTAPTAFSGVAIFTMVRRDGTNNFQILGV